MRKVFLLICFFIPIACGAHSMHIGDEEIPFHSTQYTTPSMHVQIGNEILHAPAIPQNIPNSLHVLKDDVIYSICSGEKTHVGHYWFIGACLVGADENVYLESTEGASIRTMISTPDGVRAVFRVKNTTNNNNYVWGSHGTRSPWGRNYFEFNPNGVGDLGAGAYHLLDYTFNIGDVYNIDMATFVDNIYINVNDASISFRIISDDQTDWRAEDNLGLFGINRGGSIGGYPVSLYYIMFFNETGRKLGHFVPVPAGLQIGNFTVPSNGMWDIVEQKFYGNSGTGEFIYGVD